MPQGPLFETPQDIIARLKAQREQMYASGNAATIFQAQLGSLVDSLVGNPEVRKAKTINDKIYAKMGKPAGSETEQEIQKLRAARDVYAEAGDLGRASAFNQQLLQLQVAEMEQRKLKAETVHSENEESRQAMTFPAELANKVADANEYETWVDPSNGKYMSIHEGDVGIKQQMSEKGWVPAGKPQLQGTKQDLFGNPTKPVITDLQTAVLGAQEQEANLKSIMRTFKPEYTQWATQAKMAATMLAEKLDMDLVPQQFKDQAAGYVAWRRNTRDSLNRYIKFITGAQMSKYEIDRIRNAFPNEDNSHTEFINNMREVMRQAMGAKRRAQVALRNGIEVANGDELAAKMGDIDGYLPSDAEVDAALGLGSPSQPNELTDQQLLEKWSRGNR